MDEAGTPYCITVDNETLENNSVTIRHRDSMMQERVDGANLKHYLN
jgi:glycyl-tRNA synthetase